jgi:hypothetical protein
VFVLVRQVAPVCRTLGRFSFTATRGRTVLRLPRRVDGRPLGLGTYIFAGRVHARHLFTVRTHVIRSARGLLAVHHGGGPDACAVAAAAFQAAPEELALSPLGARSTTQHRAKHGAFLPPPQRQTLPPGTSKHTVQSPLTKTLTFNNAPSSVRPLLFALLAAAILLLTAAALPNGMLPAGRVAQLVAHRRIYIAAAGIWLLVVVAVVAIAA